jgi:23S rRNA pseudouridine1911/1915/1917 synthase
LSGSSIYTITVTPEQSIDRLDKWLSTLDFIPSRSRAAELIDRGLVTLNGVRLKASQKLAPGLIVRIEIPEPEPQDLTAWDSPLEILFEDADLIVVNKPSGLVVHPAAGHQQDTLVNILLHHTKNLAMGFKENRPGIVHRLDRDTSGILVIAKNDFSHQGLAKQFKERTTHRIYWAITHGRPSVRDGTIRSLLSRHPSDRKRFASHESKGKHAITHYKTLVSNKDFSWLQLKLETGRTHQIRVHLSEKGLPILGDPVYGARVKDKKLDFVSRMGLHACELGFAHPRHSEQLLFKVDWPEELARMAQATHVQS